MHCTKYTSSSIGAVAELLLRDFTEAFEVQHYARPCQTLYQSRHAFEDVGLGVILTALLAASFSAQ